MAVLLRSVKHNGEPVTRAFDTAGIPYVIIGMTSLFNTAEAEAARQLFYFMAGHEDIDEAILERIWAEAHLGWIQQTLKKLLERYPKREHHYSNQIKSAGVYTQYSVFSLTF